MSDELKVEPEVLTAAADGINKIIGDLKGMGTAETAAEGRGFESLTLSGLAAGKSSVRDAVSGFTSRWAWGVRALVQSASSIAQVLGLAAGRYHMIDQTYSNMFKEMYTQLKGNPNLTAEQADKKSWQELLADNPGNWIQHPDYSSASFDHMVDHLKLDGQVIQTVGPDALSNSGIPTHWTTGDAQKAAQILATEKPYPGREGGAN